MRICLVYDHLYPQTVGGAERWLRDLALRVAAAGHDVDYLTLRHWPEGEEPELEGVRIVPLADAGRIREGGRRTVGPPLRFGLAVGRYLAVHGRSYEVVHTMSFPFFSVLAAAACRRRGRYELVVDWAEVWPLDYWRRYTGRAAGTAGWLAQRQCARVRHTAHAISHLTGRRLIEIGYRGTPIVLPGLYAGSAAPAERVAVDPGLVVYAGRHVPEKRIDALVRGVARARDTRPDVRLEIYGEGPETGSLRALVAALGLDAAVRILGRRPEEEVAGAMARAACLATASEREGYGLIVVEAAAHGTPSVIVDGPENAATELVHEGSNGAVAPTAAPADLADALERVLAAGESLRTSTAAWFAENEPRLRIERSLEVVLEGYERARVGGGRYSRSPF